MFVIRRLNKSCYERQDGVHPASSALYCFFYLLQGTVLVDIEEATYFIQEDDLVIIPPGRAFRVRYYENSRGYMGGFDISSLGAVADAGGLLDKFDFLKGRRSPKLQLDTRSSGYISTLLERMTQECEQQNMNKEIIKAYLLAFLAETDSVYKMENCQILKPTDSLCNKFLDMVFHNNREEGALSFSKLSVTYYAEKLNITPNHLNKVVKRVTGKSPSVWIEELIMQEAKRLLRTTSLPLGEVAAIVGLHDQSYFARRFKKHEGISPSLFRSLGK